MAPVTDDRARLRQIFAAGVAAADPARAVAPYLADIVSPALIVAVGKAAGAMARAALKAYPGTRCLVVTSYENAAALPGAQVFSAGHPLPDENGAAAAQAVIAALRAAEGPILALISGGGSALLPAPVAGVSLADKRAVNAALLGAGMEIGAMNLIRQQLSTLKGGGFLRHAAPQPVTALIMSDVIGDDISTIASGLTAAPLGTPTEAIAALKAHMIWAAMPGSVQDHLRSASPPAETALARNILVGSNRQSVAAMAKAAKQAYVLRFPVCGDVAAAARLICDHCATGVSVWGGETTVTLRGTGQGGRNQELALRIAQEAQARGWQRWACLQAGSDGRDGPTDAAGGIVDQGTCARVGDVAAYLAQNDSYAALARAGDLFQPGATGTNVADLGIMIRRD